MADAVPTVTDPVVPAVAPVPAEPAEPAPDAAQFDRSHPAFRAVTKQVSEKDAALAALQAQLDAITDKDKAATEAAELKALEEKETFLEIVDCQLFLTIRYSSKEVLEKTSKLAPEIVQVYEKALQKRREHIPKQISDSLAEGETGMLLMREEDRMIIQIPSEINVILVRPPVLSEIEKWERDHVQINQ